MAVAEHSDVYVMDSGETAFGWIRNFAADNCSGTKISIDKTEKSNYQVEWYDTWNSKLIKAENATSNNGKLELVIPELALPQQDISFKMVKK